MELLDFYADWCGPCQMMKPVVEEFEKAHPDLTVKRVNIDEEEELAEKYGVSGIPCLVFLKDGEEVAREVGVVPVKKLEKIYEKI
ncbi:thioredoxin family protein [Candidatus Saccharibacteria bacterium]|nr:thioredoxin family protein [Candidatus Saccharibacteria bacterium]MDO5475289.1 thioredoxin family protein [Candidatus Saccharibacteria bacterium]